MYSWSQRLGDGVNGRKKAHICWTRIIALNLITLRKEKLGNNFLEHGHCWWLFCLLMNKLQKMTGLLRFLVFIFQCMLEGRVIVCNFHRNDEAIFLNFNWEQLGGGSLDLKRIMDNYWSSLGLYYFVEHYLGQKRRTDMLTKSRIMDRQDVFSFIWREKTL